MDCFFYKAPLWVVACLTVSSASLCLASDEDLFFDTQRIPTVLSASKLPLKKQLKRPKKQVFDVQFALDNNTDFHQAATATNTAYLMVGDRYE